MLAILYPFINGEFFDHLANVGWIYLVVFNPAVTLTCKNSSLPDTLIPPHTLPCQCHCYAEKCKSTLSTWMAGLSNKMPSECSYTVIQKFEMRLPGWTSTKMAAWTRAHPSGSRIPRNCVSLQFWLSLWGRMLWTKEQLRKLLRLPLITLTLKAA